MPGYNPYFLSENVVVPLPKPQAHMQDKVVRNDKLREGIYRDYINYTLCMHAERRSALFAALNISQQQIKKVDRNDRWKIDDDIGEDYQLNEDYYYKNDYDKGHIAMRKNAAWGDSDGSAQDASDDTFYYSNCCLQHANVNRDEWLDLETWVGNLTLDSNNKVTSISGPVYNSKHSEYIKPVNGGIPEEIPTGFFKIVCFIDKNEQLAVRAFIVYQGKPQIADKNAAFKLCTYQVTVKEIEDLTGLDFGEDVRNANPLLYEANEQAQAVHATTFPERIPLDSTDDLIGPGSERIEQLQGQVPVFILCAMVNAPSKQETAGEWISIGNFSGELIDLKGWSMTDHLNRKLELTGVVNPGESIKLNPVLPLRLLNSKGFLRLYDDQHRLIDRARWSSSKEGVPVIFTHGYDVQMEDSAA